MDPQRAEVASYELDLPVLAGDLNRPAELARAAQLYARGHGAPPRGQRKLELAVGLDASARVVGIARNRCVSRQQEEQLIEQVRAQVDEDAAASSLSREHAQRGELPGILPSLFDVDPERPAEHPAFEHATQQTRHRQQTAIQPDAKHDARLVGGTDHRLGVGRPDGHGLFDEHMEPAGDELERCRRMVCWRRRQHDAVGLVARDGCDIVVHAGQVVRVGQLSRPGQVTVDEGDDLDPIVTGEYRKEAGACHGPAAHDDDTKRHGNWLTGG